MKGLGNYSFGVDATVERKPGVLLMYRGKMAAVRFHDGMTQANTHSHDNPAADTVPVPSPDQFNVHLAELQQLIDDFKSAKAAAEAARPQMKPKI